MDKDRIVGSAKDIGGKVEGAIGDATANGKTQASGLAREATGTAQDLYGQAKDAARSVGDAATNYAKDAYENSENSPSEFGSRCTKGAAESAGIAAHRGLYRFCACAADDTPAAPAAATAARLPLTACAGSQEVSKVKRERCREHSERQHNGEGQRLWRVASSLRSRISQPDGLIDRRAAAAVATPTWGTLSAERSPLMAAVARYRGRGSARRVSFATMSARWRTLGPPDISPRSLTPGCQKHTRRSDPLRTVTTRWVGPLRRWRRRGTGSPAAIGVAVCGLNALLRFLRSMGGILHSPLRDTHETLRFLLILGKSFFPKLHICALHAGQPPALTKRLQQLGILTEPRLDEFGPFLAESLQRCAQRRILLDEPCEIEIRHEIGELAGIVVAVCLFRHLFGLCFP